MIEITLHHKLSEEKKKVKVIPRVGEQIFIREHNYTVRNVIHNYDTNQIKVVLWLTSNL